MEKRKIMVQTTISEEMDKVWDYYTNPEHLKNGILLRTTVTAHLHSNRCTQHPCGCNKIKGLDTRIGF